MSTDSNHTVELAQVKSSKCYINIDYILQDQKISFEVFKSSLDTNCVLFKRNIPLDKMYQSKSCTQIQSNNRITYLKVDKMIQTEGRSWLSPFLSPDNLGPPPFYRSRSPNANKNYESPVRDKPHQKTPLAYKENYEVSKFKFPERTPVTRNIHANFCELNFDGTKTKKQKHVLHRHNKTQLNVKKVTSDTKLNYLTTISLQNKQQQEEFSKRIRDKLDRYCAKHHKKVNVNNQDATFDELAAEIAKKSVPSSRPKSRRKEKTAFELVLSTKGEKIEKPFNDPSKNTSPRKKPKKIIVTSTTLEPIAKYVHKYNLKNIDTKYMEKEPEKLERSESLNELFVKPNYRRPSTDKFCHEELDQHTHHHKKKKRKKHLTVTVFPCLEIKCSTKHLEMPVEQVVRPKMPRRTISPEENKILTNSVKEKLTLNDEERKNLIEHRLQSQPNIEHRLLKSQPNVVSFCQDEFPTHSGFVTACNNPSQPSFESTFDQNVNIPSQQLSFVSASNEENSNNTETTNDNIKHKLTNILTKNKTEDYSKKIGDLCTLIGNLITQKPEKTVKKLHRSRSVTPEREKSHSTSDSVKKNSEKSTEIQDMFSTSKIFNTSTISFPAATDSINSYPAKTKNLQIIHNQNQAVTISEDTSKYTLCDNCESKDIKKSSENIKTVPKNVFVIPSHVNKILKQYDLKKTAKSSTVSTNGSDDQTVKQKEKYNSVSIETSNSKPPDLINYKLAEVVKKPSIKQKLVKTPKKSELILPKKPLQSGISKLAKDENSYSTVTFNSHVDIYENYRDTKPFQMRDEINVKNTLINVSSKTTIKRSKTLPSKQEFYKKKELHSPDSSDTYESKHSRNSNQGFQSDRQSDTKPRPGSILNSTFLSSKKEIANPNNTFQKRKEYYNKLKMQMKKPNESGITSLTTIKHVNS